MEGNVFNAMKVDAADTYKQKYAYYTLKIFLCHVNAANAIEFQCRF